MTLTIREATEDDALDTLALRRAVLAEGRWFITEEDEHVDSLELEQSVIRQLSRQPNCLYLVAHEGSALVGLVQLQGGALRRMRHAAKMEILVAEGHRGQGTGGALLGEALDWAKANSGLSKIGLAVLAHNTRAIALYERHGFQIEGRRDKEYLTVTGQFWGDVLMYRFV
ncbi:MAG TPA: N-acetyltransferase [Myxococcota bacterium]|nr:N-acetyltransferase [Myxococcota bacterium]